MFSLMDIVSLKGSAAKMHCAKMSNIEFWEAALMRISGTGGEGQGQLGLVLRCRYIYTQFVIYFFELYFHTWYTYLCIFSTCQLHVSASIYFVFGTLLYTL